MSVCDSVDLPEPFGPITACTSPLEMPRETPFRICRPSTLARRSLISKSANSLLVLLHHISAVIGRFGHPRRARHLGAEEALVHLLFVDAGQAGAGGDVLDGAVAVADRKPSVTDLHDLGQARLAVHLQKGKDRVPPGIHHLQCRSFSTSSLK